MDRLGVDLRQAWRAIRARPGATIGMLLVLALGIGLVTFVFALADPFVLRPLPYANPDQLVIITVRQTLSTYLKAPAGRILTLANLQARHDFFKGVAAYRPVLGFRLGLETGTAVLRTAEVTDNFFMVLGIPIPVSMSAEPATTDARVSAMLTFGAYNRLFGGRDDALGKSFARQAGGAVRIIGVLPPEFVFPYNAPLFPFDLVALGSGSGLMTGDATHFGLATSTLIARLNPGITPQAAQSALVAWFGSMADWTVEVRSIDAYMTRRTRPLALGALAAGAFILFLCAGNVANLLLVRCIYRSRELATRVALGASGTDLRRLMLIELALVTGGALATGLFLARLGLAASQRLLAAEYVSLGTPGVTGRVVLFACATGVLVTVAVLIPAWVGQWTAARSLLGEAQAIETRKVQLLRRATLGAQSACAMVLLVGAALLMRSYVNLVRQDTGFSGDVLVVTASYPDPYSGAPLKHDIEATVDRLRRLVGVRTAAAAIGPMVNRVITFGGVVVRGEVASIVPKYVTPDYFAAVGARFLAGRPLTQQDTHQSAVVVNDAFAKRHWPNTSAIGQMVGRGQGSQVVGIVRDTFDVSLARAPEPTIYWLLEKPGGCASDCNWVSYVMRVAGGSRAVRDGARRAVTGVNAEAAVVETTSLDERLMGSIKDRAFAAFVLAAFSVAGISICISGIVGMVAFVVKRRTREVAIRIAVGAGPMHVLRLVLTEAVTASACGVVAGLLVGCWASRALEHLLYGVQAGDWFTVGVAGVGMLVVALGAALIPAVRAIHLSPTAALRVE